MKKFYGIIIATIFFFSAAHAQIVYTDVNPDTSFYCSFTGYGSCQKSSYFDLNNDGINDFYFYVHQSHECSCGHDVACYTDKGHSYAWSLDSGKIASDLEGAFALQDSDIISSASSWNNGGLLISGVHKYGMCGFSTKYTGYWSAATDKYLAIIIKKNGLRYFGWMLLSADRSNVGYITLKAYAYNSIPNQPILAGETSCSAPTVTLHASGPLSFCAGDSVILTANGTGYLYQWKKDSTNILGATHKSYVAKNAGTYTCKVTNSCGYRTSAGKKVTVTCKELSANAEINDEIIIPANTQLTIAPNPFSNSTTISFSILQSQKVSLKIFDLNGKLVKTLADAQMQAGTHQLVWNGRDERGNAVSAGIYFLRFEAGTYVETKKISVVKW